MPGLTYSRPLLLLILLACIWAYLPGLTGPFLFDDSVHIQKNTQLHITDLSAESLSRAWHSSYLGGTGSRPLAQVTFGINHVLGGLDTRYFKATNLALHVAAGLFVFVLTRLLASILSRELPEAVDPAWPALLATALWLLHPLNLSPVLYIVQRMTILSALFVVAGLIFHAKGRLEMSNGHSRGFWLALAGFPIALLGVLAKETAALYPLLVLVLEWTLLRNLEGRNRRLLITLVGIAPLAVGAVYLATHTGHLSYSKRDFTLAERLLTESRVLWDYLQWLAVPDLSKLGFYHDDIVVSRSLLSPWTTLPAVLSWLILIPAALLAARRWPVASFSVLFFLAGQAMESSIFPLELVFEHRNYLPVLGPIFGLAWLITHPARVWVRRLSLVASALMITGLALLTHNRAQDWSDAARLDLTELAHHPASPRANFRIAQVLMDRIGRTGDDAKTYQAAKYYFDRTRQLDPANINALFGLVFLELYVDRDPSAHTMDSLLEKLRHGTLGPTKLTIGQFVYLVRWQQSPVTHKLQHEQALALFDATLQNPHLDPKGRATLLSADRAYHDLVLNDPAGALPYARKAVKAWPKRWHYHYRLVQLLLRLGQVAEAKAAFQQALSIPSAKLHPNQVEELRRAVDSSSKKTG